MRQTCSCWWAEAAVKLEVQPSREATTAIALITRHNCEIIDGVRLICLRICKVSPRHRPELKKFSRKILPKKYRIASTYLLTERIWDMIYQDIRYSPIHYSPIYYLYLFPTIPLLLKYHTIVLLYILIKKSLSRRNLIKKKPIGQNL